MVASSLGSSLFETKLRVRWEGSVTRRLNWENEDSMKMMIHHEAWEPILPQTSMFGMFFWAEMIP